MSTALPLLALLEQEPAHGYTLKQRYDDRFARTRPMAFGQVYAALARFETKGWAEVTGIEVVDGPERKRYRVTDDGVAAVTTWVYTPQQPTEFAMSNLYTRVSVALTSGRSAAEVLDRQRVQHLARMRELTEQRKTATAAAQLAITYELVHLDADLRWIQEAGTRLEELR
ncbi:MULTISPECIES: PadR family transcriptional regulator [unclassified Nocardioides]|uniref:PadR family transcriptional regulator n=1 Tax=unclassified Nocardioides TaxID=2615069 RepID=UPI0009F0E06D|nr:MULTISPECIES: PadR family transcriptional regulator [unclassified Nocardioides]GAW50510.1 Transcriptional regulator, PadR-like family [Nocardioides sp. PD653-B2]GAW56634.1 Transcriptional regulator, PadR-like family [Nocardioides sp. PD653]